MASPMLQIVLRLAAAEGSAAEFDSVPWVGGAVVVLKREVFDTIAATGTVQEYDFGLPGGNVRIAGFFNNITSDDGSKHLGEDISFCHRYTAAGGKVHAYRGDGIEHFDIIGFRG